MLRAEDNRFLTESGAGTGMGELLRRFWMPVLLSAELPEADGTPKKITRFSASARWISSIVRFEREPARSTPEISAPMIGVSLSTPMVSKGSLSPATCR